MSRIGVIAEYNPFHNGHKYLIDSAKQITGADETIALMSGNFVQRGFPAIADKYTRAESAVIGGVDIVFELPVLYATGSSRDFATGAVAILSATNSVDYLAFGVEDEEQELFYEVADILADEPSEYKKALNDYLTKGLSYPSASEKAIRSLLGSKVSDIIYKPNNILAISYLTAIKKISSSIRPVIIKRCDPGYDSVELNGKYASATAIRNALAEKKSIREFVPKNTAKPYSEFIKKEVPDSTWLTPFIASRIIYDRNLSEEISQLSKVLDMTPELLNRLRKAPLPIKYIEIQDYLKTKNLTMSRVSRVLLHVVLGIQTEDRTCAYENGYAEYINLLAFRENKSSSLKEIAESSKLEIINKKSNFDPETPVGIRLWQLDKLATDLYNQLIYDNLNIRLHGELSCNVRVVK